MPTSRAVLLISAVGIVAVGVAFYLSHNHSLAAVAKKRKRRKQRDGPATGVAQVATADTAQAGATTQTGPAAWLQQAMDTEHASRARDVTARDDIGTAQEAMSHALAAEADAARRRQAQNDAQANAVLMNELMKNPQFQLQPRKLSEVEEHVQAVMRRAFWDSVRESLAAGHFEHVLVLLDEVRERLIATVKEAGVAAQAMGLRPDARRQAQRIDSLRSALDTSHLGTVFRGGAFDATALCGILDFVVEQLAVLGSEQSDPELEHFRTEYMPKLRAAEQLAGEAARSAFIELLPRAFEFVHSRLDAIGLELANVELRALAPAAHIQGIEYQRRAFDKRVEAAHSAAPSDSASPSSGLERTALWLQKALANEAEASAAASSGSNRQDRALEALARGERNALSALLHLGLLSWLTDTRRAQRDAAAESDAALSAEPVPETLELDAIDVRRMSRELLVVTRAAYVRVCVAQVLGGEGVVIASRGDAARLHALLHDALSRPVAARVLDKDELEREGGGDGTLNASASGDDAGGGSQPQQFSRYSVLVPGSGPPPKDDVVAKRVEVVAERFVSECREKLRKVRDSAADADAPGVVGALPGLGEESRRVIRAMIRNKMRSSDPVFTLVQKRVIGGLRRCLLEGATPQVVGSLQARSSPTEFIADDIVAIAGDARKLAAKTLEIHWCHYLRLAKSGVLAPSSKDQKSENENENAQG